MTKRLQTILTIGAVFFFIAAFLIDVTSFGRYWNNLWDIDLRRYILTPLIIVLVGLFLGYLLFRKKTFKQRLLLNIPIAILLFSIALFVNMLIFEFGLFGEYNYFTAKRNIQNGNIQILSAGVSIEPLSEKVVRAEDSLRKEFGYTIVDIGIWSPGAEKYNEAMEDYLEERNGIGWRDKLDKKIDSIRNVEHSQ